MDRKLLVDSVQAEPTLLERAYGMLGMASRGVSKDEFLRRPLKYLRLYSINNLPVSNTNRGAN